MRTFNSVLICFWHKTKKSQLRLQLRFGRGDARRLEPHKTLKICKKRLKNAQKRAFFVNKNKNFTIILKFCGNFLL